jgi:hypothetical protein
MERIFIIYKSIKTYLLCFVINFIFSSF